LLAGEKDIVLKKALTITVIAGALAATLTFVAAGSFRSDQVTAADAMPAYEILSTVRSMGLNPISEPSRRGPYYALQAIDARGIDMHVVADAQSGEIVSISPSRAVNAAYAQAYDNSPRIIHVPQAGERVDGARAATRARASVPADEDTTSVAEPPPQPKIPPPRPRRTVLSAPPQDELTPMHPTPRWHSTVEEFGNPPPQAPSLSGPRPPVGYTPPAALPHSD
jgi:hypothetical protein